MAEEQAKLQMEEPEAEAPKQQKEKMLVFHKQAQGAAAEEGVSNVVRVFRPSKEKYDDPNELVEEYRKFIKNDLKDGEEMRISKEHAEMLANAQSKVAAEKERETKKDFPLFTPPEEWKRDDLYSIILKESMNLLIVFGVHS